MPDSPIQIRPIEPRDDEAVADIIRKVMPEFGACGSGFAITDPEVDFMSQAYSAPRSRYYVLDHGSRLLGGAGFAALEGGTEDCCELRKMYFLPEARGRGLGRALLARILDEARAEGFRQCYLETLRGMDGAKRLYRAAEFRDLDAPLGSTGHHGCDSWMIRDL